MKYILYNTPSLSSFALKDIGIIRQLSAVKVFCSETKNNFVLVLLMIKMFFIVLLQVFNIKIFVSQFAGYHTVIPSIFCMITGKKHIIVLGGTDCNWLPSIGYGNYDKFLLKWATWFSLKFATHLLPVNKELVYCTYNFTNDDFDHQGYQYFFPDIKTPYTIIPNGIERSVFHHRTNDDRKIHFITVCSSLHDERRRKVKGIDLLLSVAPHFPSMEFCIIGGSFPSTTKVPANVRTIPFLENSVLPEYYLNSKFYLQLSMTEGFPNTLIEAMACGCVPIVSDVGAMPDIVHDTGYVLKHKNMVLLKDTIQLAISSYTESSPHKVTQRAKKYDIKLRAEKLRETINAVQ